MYTSLRLNKAAFYMYISLRLNKAAFYVYKFTFE